MKTCTACGAEKNFNDFSVHSTCKGGYRNVCKACVCAKNKAHYHNKKSLDGTKVCSVCVKRKSVEEYSKSWSNADGYRSECKACANEKSQEKRNANKKQKETEKNLKVKKLIKEFQIDAMRQFGNTIISKKIKIEEIVAEFKKEGFDVEVMDFTSNGNGYTSDSHYVVSVLGK